MFLHIIGSIIKGKVIGIILGYAVVGIILLAICCTGGIY